MTSFFVIDAWKVETQRVTKGQLSQFFILELKRFQRAVFAGDIAPLEWEQRVRTDLYYKSLIRIRQWYTVDIYYFCDHFGSRRFVFILAGSEGAIPAFMGGASQSFCSPPCSHFTARSVTV